MQSISALRSCRGLTLIEIMVAVGILGFALIGVAAAAFGVISSNEYNQSQSIALKDAQEVVELLSTFRLEGGPGDADTLLFAAAQINTRSEEFPNGNWDEAFPAALWGGRDLQPHNLPAPPMWFDVGQAEAVQDRLAEVITVYLFWYENTDDPADPVQIDPMAWPPLDPANQALYPDNEIVTFIGPEPARPIELIVVVNWGQGNRVAGVSVRTLLNPL